MSDDLLAYTPDISDLGPLEIDFANSLSAPSLVDGVVDAPASDNFFADSASLSLSPPDVQSTPGLLDPFGPSLPPPSSFDKPSSPTLLDSVLQEQLTAGLNTQPPELLYGSNGLPSGYDPKGIRSLHESLMTNQDVLAAAEAAGVSPSVLPNQIADAISKAGYAAPTVTPGSPGSPESPSEKTGLSQETRMLMTLTLAGWLFQTWQRDEAQAFQEKLYREDVARQREFNAISHAQQIEVLGIQQENALGQIDAQRAPSGPALSTSGYRSLNLNRK